MSKECEEETLTPTVARPSVKPLDKNSVVHKKESEDLSKIKTDLKQLINKAEELLIQIAAKID